MKILIVYATTNGHTRHIARFLCDRLVDQGTSVELIPVADAAGIDLARFSGAILLAPVYAGHFPGVLADFATSQAHALNTLPTLFLSVSLSAAGHDSEDWRGLDRIMQDFRDATGWNPVNVAQIAGAYQPSQYDVFTRFLMRRLVGARDKTLDLNADKIFTDWTALKTVVDDWRAQFAKGEPGKGQHEPPPPEETPPS